MLSDRCLCCLSDLSLCNVGVLWPDGWMDQDDTWYGGRPWPRPHYVRADQLRHGKGHNRAAPSLFVRPMSIVAKRSTISATVELLLLHDVEFV